MWYDLYNIKLIWYIAWKQNTRSSYKNKVQSAEKERNVGWRPDCEVGEVRNIQGCKTATWHHTHHRRDSLPAPLSSSHLRTCFFSVPLPHRMFGVGHWMLASCVLGGGWQQSEGQTPCRMWGEEVMEEGWRCYTNTWCEIAKPGLLFLVQLLQVASCCVSNLTQRPTFVTLTYTGWSKRSMNIPVWFFFC